MEFLRTDGQLSPTTVSACSLASTSVVHPICAPRCRRRLAREALEKIRPKPTLRAAVRLRAVEEKLDACSTRLDGPEVHEVLTAVVDQTHAACDEIAEELLAPPAFQPGQSQSQSSSSQSQSQTLSAQPRAQTE